MSVSNIANKMLLREFDPLDHYDYGEVDYLCSCSLCAEWRNRLAELQSVQKRIETKKCDNAHCVRDMKGRCDDCKTGIKLRSSYLASLNRRDLYSESSFHAYCMSPKALGEAYMAWIDKILSDREARPDGWWVGRAPFLPMQYWLTMFRRAVALGDDSTAMEDFIDVDAVPTIAIGNLVAAIVSGAV